MFSIAFCNTVGVIMEIGNKIKELRLSLGLTQEELADRCDLTKGYISQLENDLTSPSIATLVDMLFALGSDLKEFFSEASDERVVFGDEDYFVKEDDGEITTWLVPNSQKNSMEPIKFTLAGKTTTSVDMPHEGEEFGHVLEGEVILHLGSKKYVVKKGCSFYFDTSKEHYLENAKNSVAEIIWVSSPPNF